jgi:hypothetical protein
MKQPEEETNMSVPKGLAPLLDEKKMLEHQMSDARARLHDINDQISQWCRANYPACSCCGAHKPANMMWIATQEEEDEYDDPNGEGYGGPVAGEYYCGC